MLVIYVSMVSNFRFDEKTATPLPLYVAVNENEMLHLCSGLRSHIFRVLSVCLSGLCCENSKYIHYKQMRFMCSNMYPMQIKMILVNLLSYIVCFVCYFDYYRQITRPATRGILMWKQCLFFCVGIVVQYQ
jgi:hypothetical protein